MPQKSGTRLGANDDAIRLLSHVLGISVLRGPPSARADAGWTDLGPVLELTPSIQGRYVVKIGVTQNQSGCRDKQMFYQDYSDRGADQMYRSYFLKRSARERRCACTLRADAS